MAKIFPAKPKFHGALKSKGKSFFGKLWHSPTFTTWGSQATQSLRLLVLMPLIVTRFETPEIAAWFLFGSLMFFGDMIKTRVALTFSRMISFAMGGAKDLAPIKSNREAKGSGQPNWQLVERAYGTIGWLNVTLAFAGALAAIAMGIYALAAITVTTENPAGIWLAFGIFVASRLFADLHQRYALALKGMNYVALTARWDVIISLLSTTAGCVALLFGADIWRLALVMQSVAFLNVFRMRFLLLRVEEGRFLSFKPYRYDKEVLDWAKEPFLKGLAVAFANNGVLQLASVVYARHAAVDAAAAYLFTMKLLEAAKQVSMTPFLSVSPKMSRWMAEGKLAELRSMIPKRIMASSVLFALAVLGLALVGQPLLQAVGANSSLLDKLPLSALALAMACGQFLIYSSFVSAVANHVVCFERTVIAGLVSVMMLFILIPWMGLPGLILATFAPQVVVLNFGPSSIAADRLECGRRYFVSRSFGAAFVVHVLIFVWSLMMT